MLTLDPKDAFARGGNRLCFVHPLDTNKCIKVRRPDYTLEDLRRSKGFPKNLRPLSAFDDSQEEYRVMKAIIHHHGVAAYDLIARVYEFEETTLGSGLSSELVRNDDGRIAYSIMQYMWEIGYTDELKSAVKNFAENWATMGIPSRDLLPHNILVPVDSEGRIKRLVVIDGLGSPGFIPFYWLPKSVQAKKTQKRINSLFNRIAEFEERCKNRDPVNTFWMLRHDGKAPSNGDPS